MKKKTTLYAGAVVSALLFGLHASAIARSADSQHSADMILTNGYIYTVDASRSIAEALAIQDNRIIAIGTDAEVLKHRGPKTNIRDLQGSMVLPGLHDMHIHVTDTIVEDFCSFDNVAYSLDEIVEIGRACLSKREPAAGDWMPIVDWNGYSGNTPSASHPTMIDALDAISKNVRVVLWSADGHSAAANSATFNAPDVPITAETLSTTYADIQSYIPLNTDGQLTGYVNEAARRMLLEVDKNFLDDAMTPAAKMPKVAAALARNGITSIQHPSVHPSALKDLEWLAKEGDMTFRLRMAFRIDDDSTESDWIEKEIARVTALRSDFTDHPLVQANAVKIFADDVLEGNPHTSPSSPPNSAMLDGFRKPVFTVGDGGKMEITGYDATTKANRHYGRLTYSPEDLSALSEAAVKAGFHLHVHSIGDNAAKDTANAFAASNAVAQSAGLTQSITHLQIAKNEDINQLGELGTYGVFTFNWATPYPDYDSLVIPFIDKVNGIADLYNPKHYYMQNAYAFRKFIDAGGIPVFGSDAPVESRSSRPFRNMKAAMTREMEGKALNASQVLDVHETLAAFTINAARLMKHDDRLGSLEKGKLADIVIIDRNIVKLAEQKNFVAIQEAQVVTTIFDGRIVFDAGI